MSLNATISPLPCLHIIFKRKAEAARRAHAAEPPPQEPTLLPHKVKSVRLLVSTRRPQPEEKESSEDLPMAVDEEPEVSATITAFLLLNF